MTRTRRTKRGTCAGSAATAGTRTTRSGTLAPAAAASSSCTRTASYSGSTIATRLSARYGIICRCMKRKIYTYLDQIRVINVPSLIPTAQILATLKECHFAGVTRVGGYIYVHSPSETI
ncbi:hypothetical protein EJB05_18518 [Eragrostis curvula]|uniref:Uncharacterized protein n=1 Tax=Eragrostis curvula TaxID=38414 RepID=A0A5J9VNF0_9POAL|nr:hypothetical protein EJB05_18518 [Eragrostis curvula]